MSKKIDARIPNDVGEGVLPKHVGVKSPWDKIISFREAVMYASRADAVFCSGGLQVLRILDPDYADRCRRMCSEAYKMTSTLYATIFGELKGDEYNVHPFCVGNFLTGGLIGDTGDEPLMMCGRVNDLGTYRVEKELDQCPWDVIGSELCRATTAMFKGASDGITSTLPKKGPELEFNMVEAKGCGDLHCRVVAESRDKYPMPAKELWQAFGPIATADQIKFTPEEECLGEGMSQYFREECGYKFCTGTCYERDVSHIYELINTASGHMYVLPAVDSLVRDGVCTQEQVEHVTRCVFEASGKALFGEPYAKEGLRSWLGVPRDVDDGRLVGGYIEMYLQCMTVPYEVEAFNKNEVILRIDRTLLAANYPLQIPAYLAYWYGITKTLVNAQWSLWEEPEGENTELLRIKIAKKIDKFC